MTDIFLTFRDLCAGADGIKEADRDNGQLNQANPAVNFPCALIKLTFNGSTLTTKTQQCKGSLQVTVAHNLMKMETTSLAPDEAAQRSLAFVTYANNVYKKLQGYADAMINYTDRISYTDMNVNGLATVVMTFNFGFLDQSAED
ncbi:hypothetical protein ACFS5N_16335 [Mucilaginibacter ximonensis]|uniref:Uncharacterized protein n=1 Tax=Mucilaginibacter ximonensis TaxID=538021 RepID=A0ABW5YGU9_9SPHI